MEIADCWSATASERAVGRWAFLDTRALVEDHGSGRGCCASARTATDEPGYVARWRWLSRFFTAVVTGVALPPLAGRCGVAVSP